MNGTTKIDPILNPVSADMDRHTYGWRWLNVSTRGKRWLRLGVLGVYLDLYRAKRAPWTRRFLCARCRNGASLFFPGGSLTWPMPDKGVDKGGE